MKFLTVLVLVLASSSAFKLHWEEIFSRERFVPVIEHEGRITGGQNADITEFGYQAGLILQEFVNSDTFLCSGSRISLEWILTAAHCTKGMNYITVSLGSARLLQGFRETVVRESNCDSNPKKCNIMEHENFNPTTFVNDIAVIKTAKVANSKNIWVIKLAQSSSNYDQYNEVNVIASGWGRMGDKIGTATYLQQVTMTVIGNAECFKIFGSYVSKGNICTNTKYGEERRSACSGDSGGPLVLPNQNFKDRELIGLTSFGARSGCQLGLPASFTRVSAFRNWIEEKTEI